MSTSTDDLLTTRQVADILGVGAPEVRYLIRLGYLSAEPFGRQYMIRRKDLGRIRGWKPVRDRSKMGRPKIHGEETPA